ncbi:MAG: hypothetical protein AB7F59_07005 [Bdellovibrionales bacterium]
MKIFVVLMLSLFILSCSAPSDKSKDDSGNYVAYFSENYFGTYKDVTTQESFRVEKDASYSHLWKRNVSLEMPELPDPTICSYRTNGTLYDVRVRSDYSRTQSRGYATHIFRGTVKSFDLNDELQVGSTTNPHCIQFSTKKKSQLPVDTEYYSEVLTTDSFRLHTEGGSGYKPNQTRPADTLNEVYTKL